MKVVKYYYVSGRQLFMTALAVGVIAAALVTINNLFKEYLLLPMVIFDQDNNCVTVNNYRNGDAYTCADVGVILRKFRAKEK